MFKNTLSRRKHLKFRLFFRLIILLSSGPKQIANTAEKYLLIALKQRKTENQATTCRFHWLGCLCWLDRTFQVKSHCRDSRFVEDWRAINYRLSNYQRQLQLHGINKRVQLDHTIKYSQNHQTHLLVASRAINWRIMLKILISLV